MLLLLLRLWRRQGLGRRVGRCWCWAATIAHRLAHAGKVRDRDEAAGAVQRIAGLVPIAVVFAADDVQEVALGEAEVGRVGGGVGGRVVVEGADHLQRLVGGCGPEGGWREDGRRRTFLGGWMAIRSLGGMDKCSGRASLSLLIELRN